MSTTKLTQFESAVIRIDNMCQIPWDKTEQLQTEQQQAKTMLEELDMEEFQRRPISITAAILIQDIAEGNFHDARTKGGSFMHSIERQHNDVFELTETGKQQKSLRISRARSKYNTPHKTVLKAKVAPSKGI